MVDSLLQLQNGSDIRGVALESASAEQVNLTVDAAQRIGAAFVQFLSKVTAKDAADLSIGVGYDSRLSAEALKTAIFKGLASQGCTFYDCGLASTPSMFMATQFPETDFDGAIMITASHLPFNRNGFKFFTKQGGAEKSDISAILTIAENLKIVHADCAIAKKVDLIEYYAGFLKEKIKLAVDGDAPLTGLKIVLDASNGSGGFFARRVLEPLGADVSGSIFLEPDGMFPNHVPNPENKEAIGAIQEATVQNKADLGVIFDTDVDRAAVVFPSGQAVTRNAIVALMAAVVAKECPDSAVVTDSVTSDQLTQFITQELGMQHHRFKRGYRNVINEAVRLNKEGVPTELAIETSGHCALKENYFLDDGAYMSVKIIIELAKCKKSGQSIEALIEMLKEPAESAEYRPILALDDFKGYAADVLKQFELFADNEPGFTVATDSFEGVRVSCEDPKGFILLRMSLHDPQMPLNIESDEIGGVRRIVQRILPFLGRFNQLDISCLTKEHN